MPSIIVGEKLPNETTAAGFRNSAHLATTMAARGCHGRRPHQHEQHQHQDAVEEENAPLQHPLASTAGREEEEDNALHCNAISPATMAK
jgi:hypothetical protein